jgi:hypothetical protein
MSFELLCATVIALLVGLAITFGGYKLFLVLLPIWGFFFGLLLGAQSMQMLFGEGFLSTVTSWVVGFIVGALFAVLSYLFYIFAVAVIAGSLGYGLGVALMGLFIDDPGFLTWLVGIILAVVVILVTLRFNLAKYVIIVATALGGAAAIAATLAVGVENVDLLALLNNPIQSILDGSFLVTLLFVLLVVGGIIVQIRANASYTLAEYNNWA